MEGELITLNNTTTKVEGLYLIHKAISIAKSEEVYKIGRSDNLLKRVHNYDNGSIVYLMVECPNSVIHEANLIEIFNKKFKNKKYYGNEYFGGNRYKMISVIFDYLSNHFNQINYLLESFTISKKYDEDDNIIENKDKVIHKVKEKIKTSFTKNINNVLLDNSSITNETNEDDNNGSETTCDRCHKDFHTKVRLKRHLSNIQKCKNNTDNFIDTLKKELLANSLSLETMKQLYNILEDAINKKEDDEYINRKQFKCGDCGITFAHRQSLNNHNKLNRCKAKKSQT